MTASAEELGEAAEAQPTKAAPKPKSKLASSQRKLLATFSTTKPRKTATAEAATRLGESADASWGRRRRRRRHRHHR